MTDFTISESRQPVWRRAATLDELVRVLEIDTQLEYIERTHAELASERRLLTNRACQRARRQKIIAPE